VKLFCYGGLHGVTAKKIVSILLLYTYIREHSITVHWKEFVYTPSLVARRIYVCDYN
jgi:hypothetical protein